MSNWNNLSMQQRAEIMKLAVSNGIYDLGTIRDAYNEYANGGSLPPKEEWTMEDENGYQIWRSNLPDNLKYTDDSQYNMREAYKAGLQPILNKDGYYHLGSRNPKTGKILKSATHPTLPLALLNDAQQGYYPTVDSRGNIYTQTWKGNELKEGGSIHIKPSHRGRLTELKERTGKSEAELYNDGNPAHKKMVVFARNARKWKHEDGGNLFDDGGDKDNIFKYTNSNGDVRYVYQDNPDAEEVPVRPLNTIFPDPAQWTFTDDAGKFYTPRRTTPTNTAELNPDNRTGFERALDNYIGEALNTVPKGYHTLPAIAAGALLPIAGEAAAPLLANPLVDAGLTSAFAGHGFSKLANGEIENTADAAMTALELAPLGRTTKPIIEGITNTYLETVSKYPGIYQYPRYAMGKFKYGFDAELPTLYRKVKTLPKVENGRVMISNPNNRFAYDNGYGEDSPIITNMTTDAPVRSHGSGDWDRGLTLAFPGKTLLGKHVISTRPSDTFTFGDNISVPIDKVTAFSGRPKELSYMQNLGARTITSPEAEVFWQSGASDLGNKITSVRQTIHKINEAKRLGKLTLLKPKNPIENFSNYSSTIEDLTRETFKSPTAKDYQFMDYVFNPKYTSQTMPVVDDITLKTVANNPLLGEWAGNVERLKYLGDPSRWDFLMYDPLTPAESEFRNSLNIGLKPEYKK